MAGSPLKRQRQRQFNKDRRSPPRYPELAAIYAEKWNSFDAMRAAMVQAGIVEHGISPYDCIQRAIDDVATDYLLLRRKIDKESSNIEEQIEHPLHDYMEHLRECMVRYSTFAAQYDINNKNLKLSEARLALLANGLREIARQLKLSDEQTKQMPAMLINIFAQTQNLDVYKATALAEILGNDADIEIIDGNAEEILPQPAPMKTIRSRREHGQKISRNRNQAKKQLTEEAQQAKLGKNTRSSKAVGG
jgi:hypothetical protein